MFIIQRDLVEVISLPSDDLACASEIHVWNGEYGTVAVYTIWARFFFSSYMD